ncbi:MAG: DUF711 family protein, partial [Chloroflexi bacterium]|nr:DUF711 family protein [Chloroflexota bacterium]
GEVQTTRLATIPFPRLLGGKVDQLIQLAANLSQMLGQTGIAYASLGPALIELPESYEVIPEAIRTAPNIFFGGEMASSDMGISLSAIQACARIIHRASSITPDGFANLRFAALANVKPGAPFFPAAYHEGDEPAFAIATEAADLAVEAFDGQRTMDDGRRRLTAEIEGHGEAIERISKSELGDAKFLGIDFSLAPFPKDAQSIGAAIEKMGVSNIGLHGSLAAAALLTEAVDRADIPRAGFSGFFQPVLEDSILAQRAAEGLLIFKDLLLFSAVCGTGLDTIPLPGDTTPEQIAPLLLDLCALSLRLDKPLTARLMPIPGKQAGDPTDFGFEYFANSRVMKLESAPLKPPLDTGGLIALKRKRDGD